MPNERSTADLEIHRSEYRDFEWYWASNGTMPGLDSYETMTEREQNDFLASISHWGTLPPGIRPLRSRVSAEHDSPLILAVKAGKHRFSAFQEEHGPTWIIAHSYLKEGEKRDKTGDRAIDRAIKARTDYFERVNDGKYYNR